MAAVAVFLRGINVGGRGTLTMADLRAALLDAGLQDPRTLLQSGNVVVRAHDGGNPAEVAQRVARVASVMVGRDVGAVGLTDAGLDAALSGNPLWREGMDASRMITTFSTAPATPRVSPRRGAPYMGEGTVAIGTADALWVAHQWCPDGVSAAPALDDIVEWPAGTVTTARNRRTIEATRRALQEVAAT